MADFKNEYNGELWSLLMVCIGIKPFTLADIYNPYYPCKVKWCCKASRKKFKK